MNEQLYKDISEYINRVIEFNASYSLKTYSVGCDAPYFKERLKKINESLIAIYISHNDVEFDSIIERLLSLIDSAKKKIDSYERVIKGEINTKKEEDSAKENVDCHEMVIKDVTYTKNEGFIIEPISKKMSLFDRISRFLYPYLYRKIVEQQKLNIKLSLQYEIEKYVDEKKYYLELLSNTINKYSKTDKGESNIKQIEDEGLSLKQQILLLDILGVFEKFEINDNKVKASVLINNIIGKSPQNIRECLTSIYKNSSDNPLYDSKNPKAVIDLLNELGYTDLANTAKERYKESLSKKKRNL